MEGAAVSLQRTWTIGAHLGGGGCGQVYEAVCRDESAVAKFVPKAPGADRELLFVDLAESRNVVPVIDSGEHDDFWVLVMPKAEQSLRQFIEAAGGSMDLAVAIDVLTDIADALVDLDGSVVHRDLKPENVLQLDGHWCLADFGISRYAEATTAPDTQKYALSPPYAAPERWRSQRATQAADVYAVGVMAFEMITGARPFNGVSMEDFREAHLHEEPTHIAEAPAALAALVDECLYKAPEARPSAANFRARLEKLGQPPASPGLTALHEANRAEVLRREELARQASIAQSAAERRADLVAAAKRLLDHISDALRNAIAEAAPATGLSARREGGWMLRLHEARLELKPMQKVQKGSWGGWDAPAFDVVAVSELNLRIPEDSYEYEGRSHALWYCDVQEEGRFGWYEVAFMISAFVARRGRQNPFALAPGADAAKAVWSGMAEFQLGWPFTPLVVGDLDEFVDRWSGWFAAASEGRLGHPSLMPERATEGTWRRR